MWPPYLSVIASASTASTLSGSDIVQVILSAVNLGVLGIVFWLFIQGHLHTDSEVDRLGAENARLVEEKHAAEQQRDEAMKLAQSQIVPLLSSFVGTTSALLPLLQDLVAMREDLRRNTRRPGDR